MSRIHFRAHLEFALIQRYSGVFGNSAVINYLRQQRYITLEGRRLQAVTISLISFIDTSLRNNPNEIAVIHYGDLAQMTNHFLNNYYAQNYTQLAIPTEGNALSNILGHLLGIISSISYRAVHIWLSSIVTPRNNTNPSQGFIDLVFYITGLNPSASDILRFQEDVFRFFR